jgi:acyl-CoA thioester hydrolase
MTVTIHALCNADKDAKMPPEFSWTIRVYYEDTDAGGVVFYANYIKYFERARTEWLRAAGVSQQMLRQMNGVIFVVKSTAVDYHAPAKLDDELKLSVVVERLGGASVQFVQKAWRITEGLPELLATGRTKVGCVDSAGFRPSAIPDEVLQKMKSM